MALTILQSSIKSLPLLARGKVRDMYAVGDDKLLIVATDRISAFDVILDDPIPGKGQVLKELTDFWLAKLAHVLPNHSTGINPEDVVTAAERKDAPVADTLILPHAQRQAQKATANGKKRRRRGWGSR